MIAVGTLRSLGAEVVAFGTLVLSLPLGLVMPRQRFDSRAAHPTPVVFVHGLLGDPTNFLVLRGFLARRGVRSSASFSYRPRLDYSRLSRRLRGAIEAVCRETGSPQVDVVGHSLGGLLARYLVETGDGERVRRLVTLGAPYASPRRPPQELAVYGAHDPLVPAPESTGGRILVVPACGHLGLLYHPTVLRVVARFLTVRRVARVRQPAIRRAA